MWRLGPHKGETDFFSKLGALTRFAEKSENKETNVVGTAVSTRMVYEQARACGWMGRKRGMNRWPTQGQGRSPGHCFPGAPQNLEPSLSYWIQTRNSTSFGLGEGRAFLPVFIVEPHVVCVGPLTRKSWIGADSAVCSSREDVEKYSTTITLLFGFNSRAEPNACGSFSSQTDICLWQLNTANVCTQPKERGFRTTESKVNVLDFFSNNIISQGLHSNNS